MGTTTVLFENEIPCTECYFGFGSYSVECRVCRTGIASRVGAFQEHPWQELLGIGNEFRMRVFLDNRDKVAAHNALFAKGEVTFTLAMNKFGDLLSQEFAALFNGYSSQPRSGAVFMKPENFKAPSSVDWRSEGYVTPVKDQK